jgi:hypothetical protein
VPGGTEVSSSLAGPAQCSKAALLMDRSTLGRLCAQCQFVILFSQNQRETVGSGLATFPDNFDQAGYIEKIKKSSLTDATKKKKKHFLFSHYF